MKIVVVFGLPGAGKTFVGNVLRKHFGFYVQEGDDDLPEDMQHAIVTQSLITDAMRDRFFQNIIKHTKDLGKTHTNIGITQTFLKEKYRILFLKTFPQTKFLLIETPTDVRETRLRKRKKYPLDEAYAKNMTLLFDRPHIPYETLFNKNDGEEHIKKQLEELLRDR